MTKVALAATLVVCLFPCAVASADRIPHTEVSTGPDGSITVTAEDTPDEIYMGTVAGGSDSCGYGDTRTGTCVYINSVGQPMIPETAECSFDFIPAYSGGGPDENHPPIFQVFCPRAPITMFLNGGSDYVHWSDSSFNAPISVHGGTGNDRIEYGHFTGSLFGDEDSDVIKPFGYVSAKDRGRGATAEDVTIMNGGSGDDLVIGVGSAFEDETDKLVGGDGKDRLLGLGGPDILVGGTGSPDLCNGGKGKDKASNSCERKVSIP